MSKTTLHKTQAGKIKFMSVARAFKDKKTGKEEYSIKLELNSTDPAIEHLLEVAEYKIDTKTNRNLEDKTKKVVNFVSTFTPKVYDASGELLEGRDIPYFNGLIDSGMAEVTYSLVDYGDNMIIRLAAVKLLELELAAREGSDVPSKDEAIARMNI